MDEVKVHRFAGPFKDIPFKDTYVQSPVGLVPKAGGKTRLIFHLSYKFKNGNQSINYWIPKSMCSVKYNDLDKAVKDCLRLMNELGIKILFFVKSDLKSAFRILPLLPKFRCSLIMKAQHPVSKEWFYFVDKCLPFGASISCSHFQRFSNVLKSIVEVIAGKIYRTLLTNYLDDFLFIYFTEQGCNHIVIIFLSVCKDINFPVALDKTEWASTQVVFLGMLLDGYNHILAIPLDKRRKVLAMLRTFIDRKKATLKDLEKLAGHLNFLNRAIVPGRAFTRRMYAKFSGMTDLKPHHHIKLDKEFKLDSKVWEVFLSGDDSVMRPFIDMSDKVTADQLNFYSDASANGDLGFGAIFKNRWIFGQWEPNFVADVQPSIEFLELYALCTGIITWQEELIQTRIVVFCDNISVVHMVNNLTSGCKQCMKLIRILALNNLKHDRRVFVWHVTGKKNILSDVLSHLKIDKFLRLAPSMVSGYPDKVDASIWPVSKIWINDTIDVVQI